MTTLRSKFLLALGALAFAATAQPPTQSDRQKRSAAERLAESLDLEQLHIAAAKGFAQLEKPGLAVLAKVIRNGTQTEAYGALRCLVGLRIDPGEILLQLDWLLLRRPDILQMRGERALVLDFLKQTLRKDDRAVDVLWSMLDSPDQPIVARLLRYNRRCESAVLRRVVQDLESEEKERVARVAEFFSSSAHPRGQQTSAEFQKAVQALFANGDRDLTAIHRVIRTTTIKDRTTQRAARELLRVYPRIRAERTRREKIATAATALGDRTRAHRLVRMLETEALWESAVAELAEMGESAIPVLARALGFRNGQVAKGAATALTKIQHPRVSTLLAATLENEKMHASARITSMKFVARSLETDPAIYGSLLQRTNKSEPLGIRIAAIRELAKAKRQRHDAVNLLDRLLRADSVPVVAQATRSLGTMTDDTDPRIIMILARQLQHPEPEVQKAAIRAIIGKGAEIHLQRLRKNPDLDAGVRKVLERALTEQNKVLVGFLIADYSDNQLLQINLKGEKVAKIEEVYGIWDAEITENGRFLITAFSINKVLETTTAGEAGWTYQNLKNPYDADRLDNGNTLIADTFGRRVIEVNPDGKIVWKYDQEIHPYDADRLPNGNTLIADTFRRRVIEVDPSGKIVWEVLNIPNAHDADRLPNGNTLLTIRVLNEVREVDPKGNIVYQLKDLKSPSDADRLPDGRTVVAENNGIRIYDAKGNQVWRYDVTWAVEVNPVWGYQRDAQLAAKKRDKEK